jgi:DNA polymerase-3 subunit delta'
MAEEFSWPTIGNEKVIEFLERGLQHDKIAQTYVFSGLDDLGKSTIALAFARRLQGESEGRSSDLHILAPEPESKSISIAAAREFIKMLNLSSFLNSYKIGIIKEADRLSEEAKSALLKTLEEPREKVVIILLVAEADKLPATIRSRAQILYFYPVPAAATYDYLIKNYQVSRSLAKDLANLSLGRPLVALKFLEHPEEYKEYLERAEKWLSLSALDANARLRVLNEIFSDKSWSQQARATAGDIIFLAEGLARDLLLLSLGAPERLQHAALMPALEKTLAGLAEADGEGGGPTALKQLKICAQAKEYLDGSVNPRLVLEQMAINW